jgi:hypothetical protein
MAGEKRSTVPSAGPLCDGHVRRGTSERTLTEKGQTYVPEPKTRHIPTILVFLEQAGLARAKKANRANNLAKARAAAAKARAAINQARPRACHTVGND